MELTYEIINEDLFKRKVSDLDLTGALGNNHYNGIYNNFCATGMIIIHLTNGDIIESDGEHGENDFKDLGFKIKCVEYD